MKLEDHFKNKLEGHQVDWDKEELLGGLKKELTKDKPSKAWRLLLLTLFLFVLGFWGWSTMFQESFDELNLNDNKVTAIPSVENELVVEHETMNLAEAKSEKDEQIISNETKQSKTFAEKQTQKSNTSLNTKSSSVEAGNSKEKSQANDQKIFLSKNKLDIDQTVKTQSLSNDISASSIENNSINSISSSTTKTSINTSTNTNTKLVKKAQQKEEQTETIHDAAEKDPTISNTVTSEVFLSADSNETHKSETLIGGEGEVGLTLLKDSLNRLETLSVFLKHEETYFPRLKFGNVVESFENKLSDRRHKYFYVGVTGDIGAVNRNRSFDTNNIAYFTRLKTNESTERSLYALNATVDLGYQFDAGWFLQSGLEYTEVNELFDYSDVRVDQLTISPSEENSNYTIIERTDERIIKHYNNYKFYAIPIQLGYQTLSAKAKFQINIGMNYNIAHKFEGRLNKILKDGSNKIADLNEFNFAIKNKIGMEVGLGIAYPLLKNHQFIAKLSYRRSPSMVKEIIEQKYNIVSLGVGLRFYLGS